MSDLLDTAKWLVEHGATGVLAVAAVGEAYVIHRLWTERDKREEAHTKLVNEIQESRIEDIQAYTNKAEALHERVFKTAGDLEKAIDVVNSRRPR